MEKTSQSELFASSLAILGPQSLLYPKRWREQLLGEQLFVADVVRAGGNAVDVAIRMTWGTGTFSAYTKSSRGMTTTVWLSLNGCTPPNTAYPISEATATDMMDRFPDDETLRDFIDWYWHQGKYSPKEIAAAMKAAAQAGTIFVPPSLPGIRPGLTTPSAT